VDDKLGASGGEGGGVAFWRVEVGDLPFRGFVRVPFGAEESGLFAGDEGDIKLIERKMKAGADGFDEGFFARPAGEERMGLLRGGEGEEELGFARREETRGEVGAADVGTCFFDVDAEVAGAGDGVDDLTIGVGEVKAQVGVVGEIGFAVRTEEEANVGGFQVEVAAEDLAEQGAGDEVLRARLVDADAAQAFAFVGAEQCAQGWLIGGGDVEGGAVDVDFNGVVHVSC